MANAIITLRNKYAEDLEEILRCPICFENLVGTVPTCIQGHHVCIKCQQQMSNCPYCKSHFNGTRNFLAETLILKFDEIKVSLLDPKHYLNKQNKMCVETQTESESNNAIFANDASNITDDQNSNHHNSEETTDFKIAPPIVGKGKYPCKIGDCTEELPHGRMIPHIRFYHKDKLLEEKSVINNEYKQSWTLPYILREKFQQAISIPNMGLFFLHVLINADGDVQGYLQIVNTRFVAKEFKYKLDISNLHSSTSFEGMVLACRSSTNKLNEKCLFINNLFMKHLLKKKLLFNCSLTLTRIVDKENFLVKSNSISSI